MENGYFSKWLNKKEEKKVEELPPEEELKEEKIDEATAGETFGQEEPEDAHGRTISEILDECANGAEDFYSSLEDVVEAGLTLPGARQTNSYNPIFVGPTGVGKSSIVATWARDHGYELITLNMMGEALDFLGVKTINRDYDLQVDDEGTTKKVARTSTIPTQAFDPFLHGATKILFLDEINKTNPRILQSVYDLISFHMIQNGDEVMYLPKLLFTVGAMNPTAYGGGREDLDPALKARMKVIPVNYDTAGFKEYLIKQFETFLKATEAKIEKLLADPEGNAQALEKAKNRYFAWAGRLELAKALFADITKFKWTDAETVADSASDEFAKVLTPRTLENAFKMSDGTKVSFLTQIKEFCGLDALETVNNILSAYQDKEHIANKIWGKDYTPTDEEVDTTEEDIADSATEEERAEGEVNQSLYRKLQNRRKK